MKRLLSLLALLAVLSVSCSVPSSGARIVYGLTLAPSGIDPHVNTSSELGIPLTSVYDTLVYQTPETGSETGDFVPGLAERWEISDDGLVYTFYLKQGVTFHDGTPFNAEAVRFNLERITSPDMASQKARFMLGPYEWTEMVDEYTVRIHLSEPFAPLLDSLSQVYLGMASPAAVEKWADQYQLHQVGTGPFIFQEYVPGDHLLLRRNSDYAWAPSVFKHEQAQLEEVEFRFFADPATRSPALETGEADVMGEIPPQDAARLDQSLDFATVPVAVPGSALIFFVNSTHPPLDDVRVRQALIYGTDREAIITAIFRDTSPVAHGPLAAATFGYDPSVEDAYAYDPARASSLLEEAGWLAADEGEVRTRGGDALILDVYLMSWGYMPEVGQLLAAQWSDLGIEVHNRVVSYPEALAIAGEGQHHLIPFALFGSDPDILRKFFHSEAGFNWSRVSDSALDQTLELAAQTADISERVALYGEVQRRVMELALVIPIRDYVNLNGTSSRVQGLRFDAQGWFPWLIDVTLDR